MNGAIRHRLGRSEALADGLVSVDEIERLLDLVLMVFERKLSSADYLAALAELDGVLCGDEPNAAP